MKKLSELSLSDLVALEGIIERKRLTFYYANGKDIMSLSQEKADDLTKTIKVLGLVRKEIQTRINELELCLNVY